MLQKMKKYMEEHVMLKEQNHIVVALSGGADSVCLLLLCKELQKQLHFSLSAVHVEHGIRGKESLMDADFVEKLCKKYEVPLQTFSVDVPIFALENGLGDEEAARILRYQAFEKVAEDETTVIALAHHMEDQAETLLFQLVRGSGLTGLGAMSPVSYKKALDGRQIKYIRPLLTHSREEIEEYLESKGQNYCKDSTNADLSYSRNYIRKVILPELKVVNDQAVLHICQTADRAREGADYIRKQALEILEKEGCYKVDYVEIPLAAFDHCGKALKQEIVRQMVFSVAKKQKDISFVHIDGVMNLLSLQSGKNMDLPYGLVAERVFDKLIIRKSINKDESIKEGLGQDKYPKELVLSKEDIAYLKEHPEQEKRYALSPSEEIAFVVKKLGLETYEIPKKPYTKWVTYDKIKQGFSVRKRREKDFFVTDAAGHRKKVKAYFIEEKIPSEDRAKIWLIAQESEIVWVVGKRLSEAYKVLEGAEYALEIRYYGGKDSGSQY